MPYSSRPVSTLTAALFLAGAVSVGQPTPASAQGQPYQPPVQRFETAPQVGEPLPDLTIFAAISGFPN